MKNRRGKLGRRARNRRLHVEPLECRFVLTSSLDAIVPSPDPLWFTHFEDATEARRSPLVGPRAQYQSDWIVQLDTSLNSEVHYRALDQLLDQPLVSDGVHFETLRGLGVPGLIQVPGFAVTEMAANQSLARNPHVVSYELNSLVSAERFPNDSDFGNLIGLHNVGQFGGLPDADIDAVEAWDRTVGSSSVIVGVIDSGIDVTHPDLYLNIWINQGEIPSELRATVIDTDNDGLITFYDLNSASNANLVRDFNSNGYVDAIDLLEDPRWADGLDSDRNGFIDDFFGWNFRTGSNEPFAPNNPSDSLGHGTHVAGSIGAIGDNSIGVTGVNWRTSLMSLKFLDQNNQGDIASAVAAVHYATMMRTRTSANVRVLNSSWGQSGSLNNALRDAIESAGNAGILSVAASGNGNVLGQGVDNDRTPFYPASYDLESILSVAASDSNDGLASFSNYGRESVDIAAPGVGIRSTLPGGRYGEANGTSMATPLVSGTAALIWSQLPQATVAEVKTAILQSADSKASLANLVASHGRLNAWNAIESNIFAPVATVLSAPNIVSAGPTAQEIVVHYFDRNGLDESTIGDNDLRIRHQWGTRDEFQVALKQGSVQVSADRQSIFATYTMSPPGGHWDPLDFGAYSIETVAGQVLSERAQTPIRTQVIGEFTVKIVDPSVIYVDSFRDSNQGMPLRNAIERSNANPTQQRTIILEAGSYTLDIPHQSNATYEFYTPPAAHFCSSSDASVDEPAGWSDATNGDLDVIGDLVIVGDSKESSVIDGQGLDRVSKVHPNASLALRRLSIRGGASPLKQGGGGILSAGYLQLIQVVVQDNRAIGSQDATARGGGIASWGGSLSVSESQITENQADVGGGIFVCGDATLVVSRSTIDNNRGGGVASYSSANASIANSILSSNFDGAITSRARDFSGGTGISYAPSISRDGMHVVYLSNATNLVQGDTNALTDVFVYHRESGFVERVSVSSSAQQANQISESPVINSDGSKIAFLSTANTLVEGDSLFSKDVFVRELPNGTTRLQSDSSNTRGDARGVPAISDDARTIVYQQSVSDDAANAWGVFIADSVVGTRSRAPLGIDGSTFDIADIAFLNAIAISGDGQFFTLASRFSGTQDENFHDIYLFDRSSETLNKPNLRPLTSVANGSNYDPALDMDGRFLAFVSDDSGLIAGDSNQASDIFVYDRMSQEVTLVSQSRLGVQANAASSSPSISEDGRFIAFSSLASNLVDDDSNLLSDIFVLDRETGEVDRVSLASDGAEANGGSFSPSISGDGRFVAFESEATNLDAGPDIHRSPPGPTQRQVYVFDRTLRTVGSLSQFHQASTVQVSNATFVLNTGEETLSGNVATLDSLYAGNLVSFDFGPRTYSAGNNVLASASNSSSLQSSDTIERVLSLNLGPFSALGDLPPGYPLLQGNPALDGGSSASEGSRDQWNQVRVRPDIGALEAVSASLSGSVFADLNANAIKDANEPGLPDLTVFLDSNGDGILQAGEQSTITVAATSGSNRTQEPGHFDLSGLEPIQQNIRVLVPDHWQAAADPIQRVGIGSVQGNGDSSRAAVSATGRVVALVSTASNLVTGENSNPGIFVLDRERQSMVRIPVEGTGLRVLGIVGQEEQLVLLRNDSGVYMWDHSSSTLEAISVSNSGQLANAQSDSASASSDGQWVVFSSFANNIVPGDDDNFADVFLFDRATRTVESISLAANGIQGNNDSEDPQISSDGRWITFVSDANNLVPNDTNGLGDIFVYDRMDRSIRRINVSASGTESNGFVFAPDISGNGKAVVFQSLATNLVPDDTNQTSDLFVFDFARGSIERLNISFPTSVQTINSRPSISHDGQYVVFEGARSIVDSADTSNTKGVLVYDRFVSPSNDANVRSKIRFVSSPLAGLQNNGDSQRAAISSDGRTLVFESVSSSLVRNDTNERSDIFVAPNPFETATRSIALQVGQQLNSLHIGLVPDPGQIAGLVFEDINASGVYDQGEPGLAGWVVYLDFNNNGRRDVGEPMATSRSDGSYRFLDLPSFRAYTLGTEVPTGWESSSVAPNPNSNTLFLPAGGSIDQRDFGFRPQTTTGQFENSRIEGRVFEDANGDGIQQSSELGTGGIEVYLDLNGNERRDFDEPRNLTDPLGNYFFANLGSRNYTVRSVLPEGVRFTSPLGNKFETAAQTFSTSSTLLSKPQDVLIEDLDGVNGPDVIVALYSGNAIVVQLNDGTGKLDKNPVQVNLAPLGQGPIALASGQLNRLGSIDLVVANSLNNTVSVLLDFQATGFMQTSVLALNASPTDIKLADIDADGDLDILVTMQMGSQIGQVRILRNDGNGVFALGPSFATGGKRPASLVTGDFNRDQILDIAIANQGDFGRANDNGNVAVLLGQANGTFESAVSYVVGASPLSLDVGDLNGDGFPDLVAANFSVNTASVLRGGVRGTVTVLRDPLSVGQGPVQVSLVDIDGDNDLDILVSNLRSRSLSIVRNRWSQDITESPNGLAFEPAESFGVAEFSVGPRLVFATADLDRSGTIDMALVNSETNSLQILSNELIGGANRLQLDGVRTVRNQNFGTRSQILNPRLDPIAGPVERLEDSDLLTIPLAGIARGRTSGPPLRISVTSSNASLIPTPSVDYVAGASEGSIRATPSRNENGMATLRVTVRDAGRDGLFDTSDDGITEQSVSVTIQAVNDPPSIQLRGNQIATIGGSLRTVGRFATEFAPGGGIDELSQSIAEFIVTNDRTELFLVQPSIDNDGNLRFQPALSNQGVATIGVRVRDNGGTDFGGNDRSAIQTFQITITNVADGQIDFGDALSSAQSGFAGSYPTRIQDNGARHVIGDLFLGSFVDAELDGQPSNGALGDDSNVDDEDGIAFPVSAIASPSVPTISSIVVTASHESKIDAWIDFNQDGDWNDSGEQILSGVTVLAGSQFLSFTIPAGATAGNTYGRFRLSSPGGLAPTGLADDGEVEDHAIVILDGRVSNTVTLRSSEIADHEILLLDGQIAVRSGGKTLLSAPAGNIGSVTLVAGLNTSVYEIRNPALNLFGPLIYSDSLRTVTMVLTIPSIDLNRAARGVYQGVSHLDLNAIAPQVLIFDPASIANLNAGQPVQVMLGTQDTVETSGAWVLSARTSGPMGLMNVFTQNGTTVRISSPASWQNPMNRFDADGDGVLSPLDVLVIINHLNRLSGTNSGSSLPVFDPLFPLSQSFVDVNGSGTSDPLDVLEIINQINRA